MEKSIHVSMLLEIYGKLLTDKQRDIVDLYYNDNLSLSEIAEELGITRQGVHNNLVDAENKLFDYEEKLMILKNRLEMQEKIEKIIEETSDDTTRKELIDFTENTFRGQNLEKDVCGSSRTPTPTMRILNRENLQKGDI